VAPPLRSEAPAGEADRAVDRAPVSSSWALMGSNATASTSDILNRLVTLGGILILPQASEYHIVPPMALQSARPASPASVLDAAD
jgi:hypothetical protein